MKKVLGGLLALVMLISVFPVNTLAVNSNAEFLIGDWSSSDGVYLSYYDDETFYIEWGSYFLYEEGRWSAGSITNGNAFTIHMDGSSVLTLMSLLYGVSFTDYHFEILKCNNDNFYLVQVYDDYTAESSPCKLGFTRDGASRNFSYSNDVTTTTKATTTKATTTKATTTTTKANKQLRIASDYGDDRAFQFNVNEEIEDLVFETVSTEYNPRMASFLACLARSAYTKDLVYKNYQELGFDESLPIQKHYDEGDKYAAFTIGKKKLTNGDLLVLVTIRGSKDDKEWSDTNFNLALRSSVLSSSVGVHTGFEESEILLFEELKKVMGDNFLANNVTYVITGHSLGGAVGNLLAMRLFVEGVSNKLVYDYNYACPLVAAGSSDASVWNKGGEHNNIKSINNWFDLVPSRPTMGDYTFEDKAAYEKKGWKDFKRFGISYWFDNGLMNFGDAHNICSYIDYLAKENDVSHFRDIEYNEKLISVISAFCPVEIDVFDSQGNPIAGTNNNEPNYYGKEIGEKALITVRGDQKIIYVLNNEPYKICLHSTDEGSMELAVGSYNIANDQAVAEKRFKAVELTKGKEMVCQYDAATTGEARLYVVDDTNKAVAEVKEDGTESPITDDQAEVVLHNSNTKSSQSFPWWGFLLIGVGAGVVVAAAVIFVMMSIKKKKAAARRKKAAEDVELYW